MNMQDKRVWGLNKTHKVRESWKNKAVWCVGRDSDHKGFIAFATDGIFKVPFFRGTQVECEAYIDEQDDITE